MGDIILISSLIGEYRSRLLLYKLVAVVQPSTAHPKQLLAAAYYLAGAMYPFELHLTTQPLTRAQLAAFEVACAQLQAKPLLIELAQGVSTIQPMLGKVVHRPNLARRWLLPKLMRLFYVSTTCAYSGQD